MIVPEFTLVVVVCGLFGILIGSFLNVVVYRIPHGMSLSTPASACPKCGSSIKAYDNIPVLSWLLLGGKCRNCRTAISARYPLVELGTALLFVAVGIFFAGAIVQSHPAPDLIAKGLALVAFLYLGAISVALAIIDVETHTLPNRIVLPAYLVGAALLIGASVLVSEYGALLRAGIGLAVLWAAYALMRIAYPKGMGFGDVKLAGVLGLFLGWSGWGPFLVGSFAAFILGGAFGLVVILTRKGGRKTGIPFGPWMLAGAWLGIFFGNQITSAYLTLFGLNV
jgi:leader peptidase (prepilin peptidase) / N-methyltransferase